MRFSRRSSVSKRTAICFASALAVGGTAQAAAYSWIATGAGNWNNAANWNGGIPASATDTVLFFNTSAAGSFNSNNNVADPFDIDLLFLTNPNASATQVIGGGALRFTTQTVFGLPYGISVGLAASVGPYLINNNISIASQTPIANGTAGTLTLAGTISGAGSLLINTGGAVAITASNSYTGGTSIVRPPVFVSGVGNLGTGSATIGDDTTFNVFSRAVFDSSANVASGNNSVLVKGNSVVQFNTLDANALAKLNVQSEGILGLTPTTNITAPNLDVSAIIRPFRIGTYIPGGTGSVTLVTPVVPRNGVYRFGGQDSSSCDYIGADVLNVAIPMVNGFGVQRSVDIGGGLTNRGGKVKISNIGNTYSAGTVVQSNFGSSGISALDFDYSPNPGDTPLGTGPVTVYGSLIFEGTFGSVGSLPNAINFQPGSELYFNNTVISGGSSFSASASRWGDNQPLVLNGTKVVLRGLLANNFVFPEKVGAATFSDGSKIVLDKSAPTVATNGVLQLVMNSLTRSGRGTLQVIQADPGTLGTTHDVQIGVTSNLVDATTGMVAPYIAGDRFGAAAPATGEYFAVSGGILTPYTYDTAYNPGSDHEVVSPASTSSLAGIEAVWAARFGGTSTLTISASSTLDIRSGGVILDSAITGGNLSFRDGANPVEALPYVGAFNTGTINSVLDAGAGLTKFGTGTLFLGNAANAIAGGININDGSLRIASAGALGSSNDIYVSFNGRLDINGTQPTVPSLTGAGSVLSNSSSSTGTIVINVVSGTNTFNGTLANGSSSRTLGVTKTGAGTFVLAGQGRYNGVTNVNQGTFAVSGLNIGVATNTVMLYGDYVTAAGAALRFQDAPNIVGGIIGAGSTYLADTINLTVTANYIRQSSLSLGVGSTLRIAPNGTSAAASKLGAINFAPQPGAAFVCALDLNNNSLILDYTGASPLSTIRAALKDGFASGSWMGAGITSSTAAASPGMALGYGEATALFPSLPTTFAGQSVDDTSIVIAYLLSGDANFDGKVNSLDFNALASNFGVATGKVWTLGDFNYDGMTNTLDFNSLAGNFNKAIAAPGAAALGSIVPEPCALIFPAILLALAPRRRK